MDQHPEVFIRYFTREQLSRRWPNICRNWEPDLQGIWGLVDGTGLVLRVERNRNRLIRDMPPAMREAFVEAH